MSNIDKLGVGVLKRIKIGLFAILLSITLTLSSVIGIFAAFNAGIGSGVYVTYEYVQVPVRLNKDTATGVVTIHRDTHISWDESEQAVRILARDMDGVHNYGGINYVIYDVGAYIRFGASSMDSSLYRVIVLQVKLTPGCTYYGVSTVFPLLERHNNFPQPHFEKSFIIPDTGDYVYCIIDFTNFYYVYNGIEYSYEGDRLTGFRFDYFDEFEENMAHDGQGVFIKSVTMCQTIEAAERLFGSNSN